MARRLLAANASSYQRSQEQNLRGHHRANVAGLCHDVAVPGSDAAGSSATAGPGLLHAYLLDGRGGGRALSWDEVRAWKHGDGLLWVNLDYSQPDARAWLEQDAGLSHVVAETLTDVDPRPSLHVMGPEALLIARGINVNVGADAVDMVSMRAWIETDRIITMRRRPMRTLRHIAADLDAQRGPSTIGAFVVAVIERVLAPVVALVSDLDEQVGAGEEDLLDASTAKDLRGRLSVIRRRAIAMRRFIGPQRDAFDAIAAAPVPWLDDGHRSELQFAATRMTRTVEELDALRDRAAVCAEELSSRANDQANQRLYLLSIMTALFMPLGFVCALLGVNVGGIPFTGEPSAFWILVGVFAAVTSVQIWFFRKRGWF